MWFCIGPKPDKYYVNEKYEDPTTFDVKENKTRVWDKVYMNEIKVSLFHGFFSRFLNWANGAKSRKKFHIARKTRW